MGKINIMSKKLSELIAAGEVVERPASVIKELVENSIDAGANKVTVEIQNGGRTLIRVSDDGSGIERDDVSLAFVSHATSKITTEADLNKISTLGFRGEALASICAVSRVNLLTKTAGSDEGTSLSGEGGEITSIKEAGCPNGTTITVRDLFYNTPARMKFLKTDRGEGNAAALIIDKLALSHPEISFRFIRDGKVTLHTPGDGKLKSAVYAVYGREFTDGLIPVDYTHKGICIKGLTSKPIASRKNRNMQNFFLNGRYIKTGTGCKALDEAYKHSIMVGKYPSCVLNIIVPESFADVNVHPAKTEIRFVNEAPVFEAIMYAVKTALLQGDSRPEMTFEAKINPNSRSFTNITRERQPSALQQRINEALLKEKLKEREQQERKPEIFESPLKPVKQMNSHVLHDEPLTVTRAADFEISQAVASEPVNYVKSQDKVQVHYELPKPQSSTASDAYGEPKTRLPEIVSEAEVNLISEDDKPQKNLRVVGEAFDTYIIAEYGKDLLMIDKHAAHERLIYEKLKSTENSGDNVQMLLTPIQIVLAKNEYNAVLDNLGLIAKAGFDIDDFGSGTVILRSVPAMLRKENIKDAVVEIAGRLASGKQEVTTEKLDWIYHSIACRSAIKAGNKSTERELVDIAVRAIENDVYYCPHGRPIAFLIKKSTIEKQFGRT